MHIYIIACTGARYNKYVHAQPMHAIMQPMHAIMYWGVVMEGYNDDNNDDNGAVSQSPPEKSNSYIALLCARGCKLRRPTNNKCCGKNK